MSSNITHCKGCIIGLNAPRLLDDSWAWAHKFDPNVPVFASELYPGLLKHWGDSNWAIRNATETVEQTMKRSSEGDIRGICFYLAHGGTNFGFNAGAHRPNRFEPLLTSYNEAAPIDEAGRPTKMFYEYRDIIYKYLKVEKPAVPAQIPAISFKNFTVKKVGSLMDQKEDFVKSLAKPTHFEDLDQNQGIVIYSTIHKKSAKGLLKFEHIHDVAYVYLDEKYVGVINTHFISDKNYSLELPATDGDHILEVVVDTFGHVTYGIQLEDDRKGIVGKVSFNGDENHYSQWRHTGYGLRNLSQNVVNRSEEMDRHGVYQGSFVLDKVGDTFLNTQSMKRGMLWVNDVNLGRYWEIGPQRCLFIPGTFLRQGENKVVVLEMEGQAPEYSLFGVEDCL